jgi:hypothetical protein
VDRQAPEAERWSWTEVAVSRAQTGRRVPAGTRMRVTEQAGRESREREAVAARAGRTELERPSEPTARPSVGKLVGAAARQGAG